MTDLIDYSKMIAIKAKVRLQIEEEPNAKTKRILEIALRQLEHAHTNIMWANGRMIQAARK